MDTILKYLLIKNRKDLLSEGVDILACSCFRQLWPHGNRMQRYLFFSPSHPLHSFLFPSSSYLYLLLTLSSKFSRTTLVSVYSLTTYSLFDFLICCWKNSPKHVHNHFHSLLSRLFVSAEWSSLPDLHILVKTHAREEFHQASSLC